MRSHTGSNVAMPTMPSSISSTYIAIAFTAASTRSAPGTAAADVPGSGAGDGSPGAPVLDGIAFALAAAPEGAASPALSVALALITTGVAFKIAAVPFHYWTPDAYQGSPTPITGYLSVGPKVGAFALMIKLFLVALLPMASVWVPIIAVLAAATMTLGNLVALTQTNVKRMLAYSSIAHTGYLMVGIVAAGSGDASGVSAILFYAAAYAFMNLGAFAVLSAVGVSVGASSQLDALSGLGRRHPFLALLATAFLLSLTGIPPTAGFFAKTAIILAAVQAGGTATLLAIVAVLNAAIAAFYYLRVVVYLFMRDPVEGQGDDVGLAGHRVEAEVAALEVPVPPLLDAPCKRSMQGEQHRAEPPLRMRGDKPVR